MAKEESVSPQASGVIYNPLAVAGAISDKREQVEAITPSTEFVDSLAGQSLEQLTDLAAAQRQNTLCAARNTAIYAFRLGAVLHRIQAKHKAAKNWSQWLIANDWNQGTALRYIALFKAVKKETRLEGMLIGEAEMKFVKVATRKKQMELPASPPAPLSKTAEAREAIAKAFELLRAVSVAEVDLEVLHQAKELAEEVLKRVAELEAAECERR